MNPGPVLDAIKKMSGSDLKTYLCVDVETSGLSTARDYIIQIGHCAVRNGEIVDRRGFYLDWRRGPVDKAVVEWIKQRVGITELNMLGRGARRPIGWDLLCREGGDPIEILSLYRDWFRDLGQTPIVMHNAWGYDAKIIGGHFLQFLPPPDFWFDESVVIDTGAILRASQTGVLPQAGESLAQFCVRACHSGPKGSKWSLYEFAVPFFELQKVAGFDQTGAHDAAHDSWVTTLVFQELIARAGVAA